MRNDNKLKGSLDSVVNIQATSNDFQILNKLGDELHFLFISSEAIIKEGKTFVIKINSSKNLKCVRCWHRCSSVGQSEKHPEICSRCELNVEGGGEVRQFV